MKIDINLNLVSENLSIKEAIKVMDKGGLGFICVQNIEGKVKGIVTDGDFRRAILNEVNLNEEIITITNEKFTYLEEGYFKDQVEKLFQETIVKHIPVLDTNGVLIEIITEENFFGIKNRIKKKNEILDCEVVIMAGGKGTRLDPFTRILPKPLIPIGDKTILEVIIEKFTEYKINNFFVSVNHKAKIIKSYFEEIQPEYKIQYLHEDKPLGTVGALKQLEGYSNKAIILTNCDIIIEADYADILKYHNEKNNDITIVASLKQYKIPYGICEIENGGQLVSINEKPEYDLLVNTGMYIINPSVLTYIPENEFYHITHLIEKIKQSHKIGIYPISENSWVDTGEWTEYKKAINKYNLIYY